MGRPTRGVALRALSSTAGHIGGLQEQIVAEQVQRPLGYVMEVYSSTSIRNHLASLAHVVPS
jgi:hypothetical protein